MFTLRQLELPDLRRISELERELFGVGAWSHNLLRDEVTGHGRWYVVAVDDAGAVIGYAGIWFDGEVTQIMTIGVDPNYQRHGVGRQLLQVLINQSISLGATEMFLEVAVDNQPAINLYRSFGFLPLAIRKRYYPGNLDAYTMRLKHEFPSNN